MPAPSQTAPPGPVLGQRRTRALTLAVGLAGLAVLGHAVLDRLWFFTRTFYWPLRGWRFHVWGKQGSEQEEIGKAYWFAFTRRRELWLWELGGLLALVLFVVRHKLYRRDRLLSFILTGRVWK